MALLAKDIMDPAVLTVDEEIDALSCARTMVERRKGYAVLVRGGTTITGIVTEWDYLEKVVAPGADPAKVRMREIGTKVIHSCSPDTPTDEVVARMANLGIRRMIVRSGEKVVGIITVRNVLANFREYIDRLSASIAGNQPSAGTLG
ncbi:MAG: CBS domain-containing protein [Thermoplasmata archaeon]|nr:CBS domain-containing protein [Thermoplasmata archaeon]